MTHDKQTRAEALRVLLRQHRLNHVKQEELIEGALQVAERDALEAAAKFADQHDHPKDDFICCGMNCGMLIAAAIRAAKEKSWK